MGKIKDYFRRNAPYITIVVLIVVLVVLYLAPDIFIKIAPGEAGVLYRLFEGGTVTDAVYGEGLHAILPWNRMYIYNIRVQEWKEQLQVLTKSGLMLTLELSVRYHPEREFVAVLHQMIGPDYMEKVVMPEVESVLRTTIGRMSAEEVYRTQGGALQKIMNESLLQVVERFVIVDDVIIREVDLPDFIRKAVEAKLEQKELAAAYTYKLDRERQEAERKQIEATGFKQYNEIVGSSLSPEVLQWKGVEVSKELATSENSKIIVIGNGPNGLPIMLGSGG